MLLTIFLAIVFCVAITLMMFAAVAFIQDKKFFSSAPKEAQEALLPREKELFYGARIIGWTLMVFSFLMIIGVGVISIWDGFRSKFTFWQFFLRFVLIFTIYKCFSCRNITFCCKSKIINNLIFFTRSRLYTFPYRTDCRIIIRENCIKSLIN